MSQDQESIIKLFDTLIKDDLQREIMHLLIANKSPEEVIDILIKKMTGEEEQHD